ncbi:MAG TPA: hypothetical protein VF865_18890 [Acidobacteriaceae bacterium]
MALGDYRFGDGEIKNWPENPLETIAAYLEATYPDVRVWITKTEEPNENETKMTWYKADKNGDPIGESCASITISQD